MKKTISHLITDEQQAQRDYEDSGKKGTRKLFRHIKGEEKHHEKELRKKKLAQRIK